MVKRKFFSRLTALALLFLFTAFLTGCEDIEDTNGDSTGLATITLEELSGKSMSNKESASSRHSTRNNVTTLEERYKEIDNDTSLVKITKSSGISNILATYLNKGQKLKINCSTKIDKGNLGVILLSPNNEILHEFATGKEDSVQITAETSGVYVVRKGTESFSGEIKLSRTISR